MAQGCEWFTAEETAVNLRKSNWKWQLGFSHPRSGLLWSTLIHSRSKSHLQLHPPALQVSPRSRGPLKWGAKATARAWKMARRRADRRRGPGTQRGGSDRPDMYLGSTRAGTTHTSGYLCNLSVFLISARICSPSSSHLGSWSNTKAGRCKAPPPLK